MKIINPYNKQGKWLKGNLHAHTTNSACGHFPIEVVHKVYNTIHNYDFFAISDHDVITEVPKDLKHAVVFNGIEVSSSTSHMVLINVPDDLLDNYSNEFTIDNYQNLSQQCIQNGGISILSHPNRFVGEYWEYDDMLEMNNYTGIEILSGCGDNVQLDVAFDKWDQLLTAGKKVWGFGNDDFHKFGQERRAWNVALCEENTKASILESIKMGSFYVSTGYGFEGIHSEGNTIRIVLKKNEIMDNMYKYVTLIGKDGKVLYEQSGRMKEVEYQCRGDEGYVRVAAYLEGGYGAFSQPLFICPQ